MAMAHSRLDFVNANSHTTSGEGRDLEEQTIAGTNRLVVGYANFSTGSVCSFTKQVQDEDYT